MTTDPRHHTTNQFAYKPETWMDDAACIGYDPEMWYADDRGRAEGVSEASRTAKAICASCPVQTKCLDYAMRTEPGWTKFGIFGGLTAGARRVLMDGAA